MEILNGIDMEKVSSFKKLLDKTSFVKGVYTEEERKFITASDFPEKAAAAAFSAKEAVAKAFGRGLYGMIPKEIELYHEQNGRPALRLFGSSLEQYQDYRLSVSISYKDDYVIVSCIAYKI